MSNNEVTVFAKTDFRGEGRRFGIKTDDRRRHMYIVGKTGMGKSVLIENLVYNDIVAGRGVALLDPHGDTVEKIAASVPSNRLNDVIYFNPADLEFPIAFNVLEKVDPKYRHLVASGVVGVFKKLWADSWGPRLEYLLRNSILALLDYPDSTLLGVNRMLVDNDYRKKVVAKIKDPVVKAFWLDEYTKYNQAFMVEAIAPIQNKVGQFLSTSLIRNIVGQVKSTINIRKIMDEGKILLVDLSKGRIGEDASGMLGAMIITKIQLAAMSRVDIPEGDRKDFYLYVDEFQNFATEAFANILSEARKYRLNLIIGHQYIGQLEIGGNTVVRDAVFGNVGTMVIFRVGAADAELIAKEFEPIYVEQDFVNLPKYHVYLKLMIDGVASDPFSAATLPPVAIETGSLEKVINLTRERYSHSKEEVDDKIARWSGVETEEMIERLEKKLAKEKEEKLKKPTEKKIDFLARFLGKKENNTIKNEVPSKEKPSETKQQKIEGEEKESIINIVKCSSCGQKTKINFVPDGSRPVFCKECLKDYRREQAKAQLAGGKSITQPVKMKNRREKNKIQKTRQEISLTMALKQKPTQFNHLKSKAMPSKSIDDQIKSEYKSVTQDDPLDIQEERDEESLDTIIKS